MFKSIPTNTYDCSQNKSQLWRELSFWFSLVVAACWSFSSTAEESDFHQSLVEIESAMQAYHYSPKELNTPEYKDMQAKMKELSKSAKTKSDFIKGFNKMWREGPFSHVRIDEAKQSAEALADYLDNMNVGESGAVLTWTNDIAVLTVNTMMGQDTIKQIDAAYEEIVRKNTPALIIDLRRNDGGAFAVKPLVGHLLKSPMDIGAFISQSWNAKHDSPPTKADMIKVTPWQGWSIKSFWEDAQNDSLTRIQLEPVLPHFSGKVYVLTSKRTASAAELAADALVGLPNVTLIGETTSGEMLSQKMYDISGGLQLFLPIADYYAINSGRIEGRGVKPHVPVSADQAMETALTMALQ